MITRQQVTDLIAERVSINFVRGFAWGTAPAVVGTYLYWKSGGLDAETAGLIAAVPAAVGVAALTAMYRYTRWATRNGFKRPGP
jgi:hypothetical protein